MFSSSNTPARNTPFKTALQRFTLLAFLLVIAACDDSEVRAYSYHHSETHHHDDTYSARAPELHEFHIVDTYGVDSEFDYDTFLALSPVINQGHFEIYWDIHSEQDYFVELRINDSPSVDYSRLIMSEYCGPYLDCHDYQFQFCDYTNGLNIVCESVDGGIQSEYIGDLLLTIPDDQYLILQVCDTNFWSCEYQAWPVSME